jgi:thioredoxin 1
MEVNDENFSTIVANSQGIVMVDFWSPSCPPCRQLNPVIESLAKKVDITIVKVNIVDSPISAIHYSITGVPTLMFFKDGKLVKKVLGFRSEAQLIEIIDSLKS